MLAVIDRRKKLLTESEEEIIRLNGAAEEKMSAYEEKLRSTKIESLAKNKEIIKNGSNEAKIILDDVNKELSLIADDFHGKLQMYIEEARAFLSNQSQSLSQELAEKMLGRKIQ